MRVQWITSPQKEMQVTFNSHGHGAEGTKRETVVRISIGNPVHHVCEWVWVYNFQLIQLCFFRKYLFNDSKCLAIPTHQSDKMLKVFDNAYTAQTQTRQIAYPGFVV